MKKETRSRRVTIAVPPSFWDRFSRYTKSVNKGNLSQLSRTDLIMIAVDRLMLETALDKKLATFGEASNVKH